jgi:uncharacterized protein (DUF934 family)
MEAGKGDKVEARFLGQLWGSTFLRSRGWQGSLRVVGDVGAVPLVRRKGNHQLNVLLNETWEGVIAETAGEAGFRLQNLVFFFSSSISNKALWTRGMRTSIFLCEET